MSEPLLGQLAAAVAADPARWRGLVRFDEQRRWYHRMTLTDDFEIWLLSWVPGQQTGFHDHGDASGAFAVAAGLLSEREAIDGRRVRDSRHRAGAVRTFGPRHINDVRNDSSAAAVSIHVYSPPLAAMRRFEMTRAGLIRTTTDSAGRQW